VIPGRAVRATARLARVLAVSFEATCRALGDIECWVIGHEALRRVLRDKPQIAEDMSRILAGRQQALAGERATLSADKTAVAAPEQRLLARIRDFFHLG